jgi:SM-20-related protein
MEADFEDLITGFLTNEIGISNHFLSDGLCAHLAANLLQLHEEDQLKEAGIGNDDLLKNDALIRRDKIYWLDKIHNNPFENQFLEKMDAFVSYLNATCYANIQSYEFHYSLYEVGDFYKKHVDQFKDNASRQYSMISYLNPDWVEKDGGELLVYQTDANQMIAPTHGKTVFFKSSALEHEVLVTKERRMSIAGWLKT